MSLPPKSPPRFVPTLTEVVQGPDVLTVSVPLARPVPSRPESAAVPLVPGLAADNEMADISASKSGKTSSGFRQPLPQGMEEYMVHRVMQRVDVVLDHRLREAIALVVQEQTRSLLPRLREEIESVVRHSVYEAVADELASGNGSGLGR